MRKIRGRRGAPIAISADLAYYLCDVSNLTYGTTPLSALEGPATALASDATFPYRINAGRLGSKRHPGMRNCIAAASLRVLEATR